MPRNITPSGRRRSTDEQLFTAALMERLDYHRERRSMDQRAFAAYLGVHESLLSLYRSGQRLPSITGFIELEKKLPSLLHQVVQGYYRLKRRQEQELARDRDNAEQGDDGTPERQHSADLLPVGVGY